MATNRWLNTLNNLKTTTDTLRQNLIDGGINVKPDDTLDTLVACVPALAPRTITSFDKWEPDPLWVFPDPNGSGQSKTIREIYDEDSMANDYTYRGIYMFYGDRDELDLKAMMSARANADTFITSDGTTYTDIPETTLIHTWDKNKDIYDSKNRIIRYVKIYTNTAFNIMPGFYRELVWCIHGLGTSLTTNTTTGDKNAYYLYSSTNIECIEFSNKITSLSGMNITSVGYPLKVRWDYAANSYSVFPNYSAIACFSRLIEVEFPNMKYFNNGYSESYMFTGAIQNLKLSPELTTFTLYRDLLPCLKYIDLSDCNSLKSITINSGKIYSHATTGSYNNSRYPYYNYSSPQFVIPNSVTSLTIYGGSYESLALPTGLVTLNLSALPLQSLTIPETVTTLSLQTLHIKELTIPTQFGQTSTTTEFSLSSLYDLKRINLPIDYDRTSNFSCNYLEHENLLEILTNLKNNKGLTTKKLTLGSINLAKLSDEEKAIATNKNWTLA